MFHNDRGLSIFYPYYSNPRPQNVEKHVFYDFNGFLTVRPMFVTNLVKTVWAE